MRQMAFTVETIGLWFEEGWLLERDRNVSGRGLVVDCIQNFLKTTQMNMILLNVEIFIVVTRISFLKDTMH